MPTYRRGEARIHYEEQGQGFPLLLLAPGGMRSTIDFWRHASINPWPSWADGWRLIAMDQRNAGASTGPLEPTDPWGMYAADQLGLLDHLGVERFAAFGCCIGGSFILKLAEVAPERLVAAVLQQPIGVEAANRELFAGLQSSWADELAAARDDLDRPGLDAFLAAMWSRDFVVSVEPEAVAACTVPLLVLPGIDDYHPGEAGRRVAELARSSVVVEPWKDTPEHVVSATAEVRDWLGRTVGSH